MLKGLKNWIARIDPPIRPQVLIAFCGVGAIGGALVFRNLAGAAVGAVFGFCLYMSPSEE